MAARTLLDKIITDAEPAGETRGPRAFAAPALRPYLPDQRFLRRIGVGLGVLAASTRRRVRLALHHVVGAPAEKPTTKDELLDAAERLGAAVLVAVVAYAALVGALAVVGPQLLPYLPLATGVGVLGLLGAAYALGAPAPPSGEPSAPAPAAAPGPTAPVSPDDVARAVREIAVPRGWAGAHITTLIEHLQADREAVLDALAEAGIAVTEQLKLTLPGGRQSNRQGVRLTALPEGLGEAPAGPPQTPAEGAPETAPKAPARPLPEPLTVHPQGAG